ncbi:MAG: hypothetical protein E7298_02845 [Lachnospiraceae bacterium]|nr:hypothetical protein [Lachnospiraceae bacterium]
MGLFSIFKKKDPVEEINTTCEWYVQQQGFEQYFPGGKEHILRVVKSLFYLCGWDLYSTKPNEIGRVTAVISTYANVIKFVLRGKTSAYRMPFMAIVPSFGAQNIYLDGLVDRKTLVDEIIAYSILNGEDNDYVISNDEQLKELSAKANKIVTEDYNYDK